MIKIKIAMPIICQVCKEEDYIQDTSAIKEDGIFICNECEKTK